MEMRCYRKILLISYKDHITSEEVRTKIQQAIWPHEDLLTIVKRRKLQWYGHVSRSSGLAKTILQGTVKGGRRQAMEMRCYRKIQCISYKDHVTTRKSVQGILAGNRTTRIHPDHRKETQTAVVWTCLPFIRFGKNYLARYTERGKKTRQTEEEVGRQQQGMDRLGVRQVPEGSGEQ